MYFAYKLNEQGGTILPWCTPFPILNQFVVPCLVLTVASWPSYRFLRRQIRWSSTSISLRVFYSLLYPHKGFSVVSEAEVDVNSLAFSMIQWLLAIWSLVPLPLWNPGCTSGSSWFTYCWSLAWKTFERNLASMWNEHKLCSSSSILWHCPSLGLECKLSFSVLWPLLSFPDLLTYWVQHFSSSIF